MRHDFSGERRGFAGDLAPADLRREVFVRKIDRRLEMRQEPHQAGAPAAVERAERAVHLTQRLTPLRLGFGGGQIGDRFGLGQVELAVEKSAASEFARLREAKPHPA